MEGWDDMLKTYENCDLTNMQRIDLYDTLARYMNRPGCNLQIPVPGKPMTIALDSETFGGIHFEIEITDGQALDLLHQARQSMKENYNKLDGDIADLIPMTACIEVGGKELRCQEKESEKP